MESKNYTCENCIWNSQCPSREICDFFDNGQYNDLELSDEEIELRIETDRNEYRQAYQKYIQEFTDGNKE